MVRIPVSCDIEPDSELSGQYLNGSNRYIFE
jgi:hypothetical protein